jgi:hypothetical protein
VKKGLNKGETTRVSSLQLSLEISISSNSRNLLHISTVQLLYTVNEKGGKPDRKQYPLSYDLRNPHRNLKSENSQDYAHKPQRNCALMNSASGVIQYFAIDI